MRQITYLLLLVLFCLLVLMPAQVSVWGRTFYRPVVNLQVGASQFYRDLSFKLGLDLQGGTHLVYQADTSKIAEADRTAAIESVRDNIERRINFLGVAESVVQTSKVGSDHRLIVELPGVTDISQAVATIGQTAQLEFRELAPTSTPSALIYVPTDLTGADLRLAQVQFGGSDSVSSAPVVAIEFNSSGRDKFAAITKRNIDKQLAIFLDDRLVMDPVVQTEIPDGKAIISGNFTIDDAKQLAIVLNAGALPVPIKIIEQRNIGATLGQESVAKSVIAGIIGLILTWLFLVANYGLRGILASLALVVYILISLTVFKLIPITLTLSGIAGFILSIGAAVDANILIFERIKEELRWGRPPTAALELGFHRAWNSIRDSNVSSIITASLLFFLGTGPVRGFAITLIAGILVSLFTSITVTRTLLRLANTAKS